MLKVVLVLTTVIAITVADIIVSLPDGKIKGKLQSSSVKNSDRQYYGFYGLRYAKPPTGDLRFQPPQSLEPWTDVYDGTSEKRICYQVGIVLPVIESEDCLLLDVYTPKLPGTSGYDGVLLPVIFNIHGGGFNIGAGLSAIGYGPDFFMDYDVIVVNSNYRLGPFGFLSTGDDVISGNAGLKDQQMALKWVQKNIEYFGGDPSRVTIMGQSAGAASVSYHLLSPNSAGLFRAAIMESGSALCPFAYQRDLVNHTRATAAYLDKKYDDSSISSKELMEYLVSVDAAALDNAAGYLANTVTGHIKQMQQGGYYGPVIEVESNHAFITAAQYGLFEKGNYNKVPVLIGTNAEEAIYLLGPEQLINLLATQGTFDTHVDQIVPDNMHITSDSVKKEVGTKIKTEYINGVFWELDTTGSIRYFTDQFFARSIIKQAELQAPHSDVYFYTFSYHGKMGVFNFEHEGLGNVSHIEEIPYLFTLPLWLNTDLSKFGQDDLNVHYRLLSMWTNFVKKLDPTPETDETLITVKWPKVTSSSFKYLDITKDLEIKTNPKNAIYTFWQNLYDTYGVKPYDTF